MKKQLIKRMAFIGTLLLAVLAFYFSLPNPLINKPCSTVIYDKNGKLLGARIAANGQWQFPATDTLPEKFKQCMLEFEDRYFFYHPGINAVSMAKAFARNIKSKKRSGASTITMQLARISRNSPPRTYLEKLTEMLLALRIECSYSKIEILNMYAHNAPFGGNVVGIHAASWRYYGREPEKLSWAETALLSVLPNAPSLIYPGKNRGLLLSKRNRLLHRLRLSGAIDETTYRLALQENIPDKAEALPQPAPHLLQRAINDFGVGKIYTSTVDKEVQEQALAIVNKETQQFRNNGINNACALILDTESGEVLAYVGNSSSRAKKDQNDVDIIAAERSSGSILKPVLYAFLINEGKIAPHSLIEDTPMQIGSYAPKNYNLTYDGLVAASEALTRSLNVPAVKMLQLYGVQTFLFRLRKIGFSTIRKPAVHYGLSLILGGAEVSPWDVAAVYSGMGRTLINYNKHQRYYQTNFRAPVYLKEKRVQKSEPTKSGMLSAGSIWVTFNSMTELARPDNYSGGSTFSSLNKIAWKTGTSFGYRDAWAVGVNQRYTIVVWVGNADGEGRPGLTGINVAAPLLFSLYNSLQPSPWFNKPARDLTELKTCYETGYKWTENCPRYRMALAPPATLSSPSCYYHKVLLLDSTGRYQVNSQCYPVSKGQGKSYLVLSPLQEFFYKQKHLEFTARPPLMPECSDESADAAFDIIYPRNGYKIYLPLNENNQKNELILSAAHSQKSARLFWYLDKEYIGTTTFYHQLAITPQKGKHQLLVTEEHGKTVKLSFEIIDK